MISEFLAINSMCESGTPPNRVTTRLESAARLFVGELRTTRNLLYQPQLIIEESVLSSILATLDSALTALSEVLTCLPPNFSRSQPLSIRGRGTRLRLSGCAPSVGTT